MEGDERGRSMAPAPACTMQMNDRAMGYYGFLPHYSLIITDIMMDAGILKSVIPLNCEPTHSLLEEEPDSSDPGAMST